MPNLFLGRPPIFGEMRARRRYGLIVGLLIAGVLTASALFPAGLSGTSGAGPAGGATARSPAPALPSVAPVSGVPFAERAGYSDGRSASVVDPTLAGGTVSVLVTFQPRDPSFFVPPAPGTPALSTPQVAQRFGLSVPTYAGFVAYFRSEGLTVAHTWPDRLAMTVTGTATAIDRAFGTTEYAGSVGGRPVLFPGSPPVLPPSFEPFVASVIGLSSGFVEFSSPSLGPVTSRIGAVGTAANPSDLVTPAIARAIYGLSSLYNRSGSSVFASSQAIALLLWGPGYAPSDLQTFFQQDYPSGFPAPAIVPEPVDGAPMPSAGAVNDPCGASEELTLDVEWSGSMAPGATLYPVYAPEGTSPSCSPTSLSMADALHTAVGLPVDAISMSFGTAESSDASLAAAWSTYLAEAAQRGITLLAATGDLGGDASAGCSGGPAPNYPATSPEVLAVGGTNVQLIRNLLGVTGYTESAWNDSGGGFSTQFPAPSWQSVTGNPGRGTPDVSATAAFNYVYFNGRSLTAAGTSFATPLWGGLITEMDAINGQPFGFVTPRLYAVGAAVASGSAAPGLVDVTTGSTCIGTAQPGWDPETGWGSPSALALYEDLTATFVNLSLSLSPNAVGPGGSVTISGHLANRTTGAPISGVPVRVSMTASSPLGPCTGTFGSAQPTTDAFGNVSEVFAVPVCYLGSRANVELLVVSNGYYGVAAGSVAVNLLAFVPALSALSEYPWSLFGFAAIMGAAAAAGYVIGRPPRRASPTPRGPVVPPAPASPDPNVSPAPAVPAPSLPTPEGPSTAGPEPATSAK